jgi:hypothetical protein
VAESIIHPSIDPDQCTICSTTYIDRLLTSSRLEVSGNICTCNNHQNTFQILLDPPEVVQQVRS